jgi:hypothetical protein
VEPEDADLGDGDVVRVRLGDHAPIGAGPIQQTLQRAVPRALLLYNGLQLHVRRGSVPGAHERPHRAGHGGEACLHVPGAAAIHPIAVAYNSERRVRPQLLGGRRHDVYVAVQDQRAPATGRPVAGRPVGDDVALVLDVPREWRGALRVAQRSSVQANAARLEPAAEESLLHHRLPGFLGAEHGRRLDEADEELLHPAGLRGDRGEDGLVGDELARRYTGPHPTLPSRIWRVFRSE